jgi:hypothetical protein
MSHVPRFDHVGLTVADLDVVTAFVALGLELSSFVRPDSVPGSPAAMANELGLRNVAGPGPGSFSLRCDFCLT